MKFPRHIICNIFAALIVGSVFSFFYQTHIFKRFDLAVQDFFARRRLVSAQDRKIVIVEITDDDIQALGGWPLKRSWHADMCDALSEMGARAVFFDSFFSGPTIEEDDVQFEKALMKRAVAYLPSSFQNSLYRMDEMVFPLERFSRSIRGTGSVELYPDMDGVIREVPLYQRVEGRFYPSMVLRLYMDMLGYEIKGSETNRLLLGNDREQVHIPLSGKNTLMVNWRGQWRSVFRHFGFLEVLQGFSALQDGRRGMIRPEDFKDSICLIGVTARSLNEVRAVPIDAECPRVAIFAAALSNLIDRAFFPLSSARLNTLLIFLLALLPVLVMAGLRPMEEILILLAAGAVYFYVCLLLFTRGIYIDCVYPLSISSLCR